MQLKVIKSDGSAESYFHTKVVGAISNAFARADYGNIFIAEHLAEVVTYYLYNRDDYRSISSNEIFSIILALLTDTGHEDAAVELSDYHFKRKLQRARTEVVPGELHQLRDAQEIYELDPGLRNRWDKSIIVRDLMSKADLELQPARAVASNVEEKIFATGMTVVPTGLIKQFVFNEAAAILRAQKQLQTV
ncbi:MAG: ATP cone domain-containing protein [Planctomycetota bacterium]|jgi:transcriptional regulator NrdR family protein